MEYYQDSVFIKAVQAIQDNGTMNVYVNEAIENKVILSKLKAELKQAIKMHRKYDLQPGSSPLHCKIVIDMTYLLSLL